VTPVARPSIANSKIVKKRIVKKTTAKNTSARNMYAKEMMVALDIARKKMIARMVAEERRARSKTPS
jgi:hypothetical protein